MMVRSAYEMIPRDVRESAEDHLLRFLGLHSFIRFSTDFTFVIDEFNGWIHNDLYKDAMLYLRSMALNKSGRRLKASSRNDDLGADIVVSISGGEEILDSFEGVQFRWRIVSSSSSSSAAAQNERFAAAIEKHNAISGGDSISSSRSNNDKNDGRKKLELTFHKKHKDLALNSYLRRVRDLAKAARDDEKSLKIHTNSRDAGYGPRQNWSAIALQHPSTFDTLAIDAELKRSVMDDLEMFVQSREYYGRIGKPWKRGYLLHGPPGTGKSSLVAAMANYLKFDIYDIELTNVHSNIALRNLLIGTTSKSIIVVEDIDCSVEIKNRAAAGGDNIYDHNGRRGETVTLSGLLNCIDGLWSSCGEERIIVVTTNYKDRLDPALLRPGRMDMHVYMGYCGVSAFRQLFANYHGVAGDHRMFPEVEELLRRVEVTPAEVAEELMKSRDADVALDELLQSLHVKADVKKNEEDKAASPSSSSLICNVIT